MPAYQGRAKYRRRDKVFVPWETVEGLVAQRRIVPFVCVSEDEQRLYPLDAILARPYPRKLFLRHPSTTRHPMRRRDSAEVDFPTFKKLMLKAGCEIFQVITLPGRYQIGWARDHVPSLGTPSPWLGGMTSA